MDITVITVLVILLNPGVGEDPFTLKVFPNYGACEEVRQAKWDEHRAGISDIECRSLTFDSSFDQGPPSGKP